MCTEVNSVMGLQATAATKRKHEITFDGKEANTYTNCSPPIKVSKWSKNSSLVEAMEEKILFSKSALLNNNNSNNSKSKNCSDLSSHRKLPGTTLTTSINNGTEVTKATENVLTPLVSNKLATATVGNEVTSSAAMTPLPPTASSPVPEDSIAKLEEVAAAHCETWHGTLAEPVDCISKLQAVAVPSDPWGSIATRSTLATTLLSSDEIDDDDDDFEDDYEEEESIIPTYCPLRYHPFAATPANALQQQRAANYAPSSTATHGSAYGNSRPNYYSEPFPQQNCSRTGGPQHLRISNGGVGAAFPQWPSGNGAQQFYVPPEAEYPPPQQQQTIRCAENGKSYLDLGCSTPPPPMPSISAATTEPTVSTPTPPPSPYSNMQHIAASALEARHAIKRCCEGRGTWCNTNKHCYKDIRMKIRNLSMFKLSRFRQVSEQSLYRSVLICNTLKYIDREIETETKEIHQAAHAAHQHHQHTQYQHLHHPHHLQHHHHHHHHNLLQHNHNHPQQQQHQQQQPPQQHQEYSPVLSCARVSSLDYQALQHQTSQQHFQQQQHQPHLYNHHPTERLPTPQPYHNTPQPQQEQQKTSAAPTAFASSSNNCDPSATASASLHPYDHYPFRESHSGRVTPFPNQPVISTPPASSSTQQQQQQQLQQQQHQPLTSSAASTAATATVVPVSTLATTADTDSCYADDDCTRSINWSSVLSLSSQSALDPLNNNELFSIIPSSAPTPTATILNNASASNSIGSIADTVAPTSSETVAISGSFTTVQAAASSSTPLTSATNRVCSNQSSSPSATTTATFTTLSTISSATYSMTSSYASSLSQQVAASSTASSSWEYGFLDMDFGLGSEFTELMPSCKLSSDELFKSALTPVSASRYSSVHDNELEQPAHIMVGS